MRILVTGGAGFIGSNLVEKLLQDKRITCVRVLDNLVSGSLQNIKDFLKNPVFEFIEADIRNYESCLQACENIDLISHQAALGSVPRSIKDPITSNDVNISGTLNIFTAARERKIKRIVYASSSSVYGDDTNLPKKEERTGNPLSPYAVTKCVNELYAKVFADLYKTEMIGLRYFNVFGPRQNPEGPYAAVIPLFIKAFLEDQSPVINGDGTISRDFTFIDNAVQANILSLFTQNHEAVNKVYNIAYGKQLSLTEIVSLLQKITGSTVQTVNGPEREGDIKHSFADISRAMQVLGYEPSVNAEEGLKKTFDWYQKEYKKVKV